MANPAATFTAIANGTADVQGLVAAAGRRLLGWSVRESAGTPAAARVFLRHGTSATDPIIALIQIPASGLHAQYVGDRGLHVPDGVFVDRIVGDTELVLWHVTGA